MCPSTLSDHLKKNSLRTDALPSGRVAYTAPSAAALSPPIAVVAVAAAVAAALCIAAAYDTVGVPPYPAAAHTPSTSYLCYTPLAAAPTAAAAERPSPAAAAALSPAPRPVPAPETASLSFARGAVTVDPTPV